MLKFRTWAWARIDGRNVLAMPTRDEIHLYDSEDFILLDKLTPTGHRSYIQSIRWSAFHGKIASLSSTQLIVHAPQLVTNKNDDGDERIRFVRICDFDLAESAMLSVHSLTFSRCAEFLLFGGHTGLGMINIKADTQLRNGEDLRLSGFGDADKKMIWSDHDESCDIVKFSPCSFVFATLHKGTSIVKVWRMTRLVTADGIDDGSPSRRVLHTQELVHPDHVVYMSWKPATTQMHAAYEYDGSQRARWFEPQRMLLSCTQNREIRIWIETASSNENEPTFTQALLVETTSPLRNVRWVLSKNRNISEEKFQVLDINDEQQMDWISGVDTHGVLHLYQVLGIASNSPRVRDTELRIKVNGEDEVMPNADPLFQLEEICVMAYFSQNYFGMPSKFDIVLQRSDGILLSYIFSVGRQDHHVRVVKKSWYRSHLGTISAIAAHPSLPLIASVDNHQRGHGDIASYGNEILIYWISFSAFSAESRLIPSGVVECPTDSGQVLCVQWIPTMHFDATPMFLVAYTSGIIDIYGRAANAADVLSSPHIAARKSTSASIFPPLSRSPSLSPWTFYDYATGESGIEYEISVPKLSDAAGGLGFQVESDRFCRLCVVQISSGHNTISQGEHTRHIAVGDQVVSVDGKSMVGKTQSEFDDMISTIPSGIDVIIRCRAKATNGSFNCDRTSRRISPPSPLILPGVSHAPLPSLPESHALDPNMSLEAHAEALRKSFMSSTEADFKLNAGYVHAGSVSIYGGWRQLLSAKVSSCLRLVCVCPVYADDGEYIPSTVLIFAVSSLPGRLCAWRGAHNNNASRGFELTPLHLQDSIVVKKDNITSIAGERDYRQRAFTSKRSGSTLVMNSLVFVGDATGAVEHWRCRVSDDSISFTMMSSCRLNEVLSPSVSNSMHFDPTSFFRRGYFSSSIQGDKVDTNNHGVYHIEVDDPNRIAVLHGDQPYELHIFEGESGLGILRLEETIVSAGRGRILGFCWCNSHVEFNVDALAVNYESSIVIYHYDMHDHRWIQVGNDIITPLAIFDCTRDASALLIGGGRLHSLNELEVTEEIPIVLGKWDEPGTLLQSAMDWKTLETPKKLPVWHPYVVITTLFGMHARVGVKDTALASDKPSYSFSKAFKDAVQMLKLLAKVLEDDTSTQLSANTGVLVYTPPSTSTAPATTGGIMFMTRLSRRNSIGRYSTSIHMDPSLNKAENLFQERDPFAQPRSVQLNQQPVPDLFGVGRSDTFEAHEAQLLTDAIDSLLGRINTNSTQLNKNAALLFDTFTREQFFELKAVLHFVNVIQTLGFELDASAADLGAKRFYSMVLFGRSLKAVLDSIVTDTTSNTRDEVVPSDPEDVDKGVIHAFLHEAPSSGIVWALHSDSQQFLWEHCVSSQPTWIELRPLWLGLWIRDVKDLRMIIEKVAKSMYMKTRDAMDVALFYIALGKKNILGTLAKVSKLESNKSLSLFLENDFTQERWCNAAIKNAYSLLSKKRYETAAAFFLLCEPPRLAEALRLLTMRLLDPSLALIISRLVEYRLSTQFQHDFIISTSSSQNEITPIEQWTRQLLERDIIPIFRTRQDRWLESCALWWLEDFEQACTILLPQSQSIDVNHDDATFRVDNKTGDSTQRSRSVTYFYINLTSIPIYFQFLHSNVDAPLVQWATKKIALVHGESHLSTESNDSAAPSRRSLITAMCKKLKLSSMTDIEHAFSFSAYVCKRSGMSDTSLIEMLHARHLVNLHAKVELVSPTLLVDGETISDEQQLLTSPRMQSLQARSSPLQRQRSFNTYHNLTTVISPRRMSELSDIDFTLTSAVVKGVKSFRHRSNVVNWSNVVGGEKGTRVAPWLKAQIADMECRRWSSSAFVGKMIGIRVARELISHFRTELDECFRHFVASIPVRAERHRDFLQELCAPLCEQFQVDPIYVFEAALAVMQPRAYLHIPEIVFLLAVLERSSTLIKWIQYVALSMLNSCTTFASTTVSQAIYRDWEGLTIQLCYVLHLSAQRQIELPHDIIGQVAVAVRTGCMFLSWSRQEWRIVRQVIDLPFYSRVGKPSNEQEVEVFYRDLASFSFQKSLEILRALQQTSDCMTQPFTSSDGGFGYMFMKTIAVHLQGEENESELSQPDGEWDETETHSNKLYTMYRLILMVSILRTLYARAQVFLMGCQAFSSNEVNDKEEILDLSSSLFTPRKLWKPLTEAPLNGLKRWYSLIESHLRCEFDYSVKEVTCICGLYGLDRRENDGQSRVVQRIAAFERKQEEAATHEHRKRSIHRHHSHTEHLVNPLHAYLQVVGISIEWHEAFCRTSDDYILLLMRHPKYGVTITLRRFRLDPRVHERCFVLKDAFSWLIDHAKIFNTVDEARQFLSRCCKERKLRLLVKHRGQDAHRFPMFRRRRGEDIGGDDEGAVDEEDCKPEASERRLSLSSTNSEECIKELSYQSMMFVDRWEVEATGNVLYYMHQSRIPLHIELGWDRLSPIRSEMGDDIAHAIFHDADLVEMWRSTCGEGWLVTSITQYQLDGVHSHRSGREESKCVFEDSKKVPFLIEIHSRSQRNELFKEVGLPHRFVGSIKVKLLSGSDLIPATWIEYFVRAFQNINSEHFALTVYMQRSPYVFFALSSHPDMDLSSETWSVQTYRSRCGNGGTNPEWGLTEDEFVFRFAIPTHKSHTIGASTTAAPSFPTSAPMQNVTPLTPKSDMLGIAENVWDTSTDCKRASEMVEVLESLFESSFTGPPLYLHCTAYHKTKLFAHHFMGRGKISLLQLSSGNPIDVWIPLEGVASGSIHINVSLSFQLMCSSSHSAIANEQSVHEVSHLSDEKHNSNTSVSQHEEPAAT